MKHEDDFEKHILCKNYDKYQYDTFLKEIDRDYDDGYGSQNLFGTIWCTDGIWLDRHEYDGAEGWEIHEYRYQNKMIEE